MSQKTIGLICAIPQERVDLKAALDHQETIVMAGLEFDHGRLDGHGVIIAEAGIGKVNASMVATLLASRFGVDPWLYSITLNYYSPTHYKFNNKCRCSIFSRKACRLDRNSSVDRQTNGQTE